MTKKTKTPGLAKSAPVDIEALAAGLPAGTRAIFDERKAAHQSARFVRRIRQKAGLTQHQLADAVGTTQAHISDLERGVGPHGPTVGVLNRIAHACGEKLVISTENELSELKDSGVAPVLAFAISPGETKRTKDPVGLTGEAFVGLVEDTVAPTLVERIHQLGDQIENLHGNLKLHDHGVVKVRTVGAVKSSGAGLLKRGLPVEMVLYLMEPPKNEFIP